MKHTVILALSLFALVALAVSAQTSAGPGTVTISYNLFHPHWIASNQLAVWIEDSHGAFVKTIFATDFMARRKGYIKRPQSCPEWVKASGLASLPDASVDAISGATQKPGPIELSWNCTDANGKAVPPGVYTLQGRGEHLLGEARPMGGQDRGRQNAAYLRRRPDVHPGLCTHGGNTDDRGGGEVPAVAMKRRMAITIGMPFPLTKASAA